MSWSAPAPVLETRIFSVLPAEFRCARVSAWSEANKGGAAPCKMGSWRNR